MTCEMYYRHLAQLNNFLFINVYGWASFFYGTPCRVASYNDKLINNSGIRVLCR